MDTKRLSPSMRNQMVKMTVKQTAVKAMETLVNVFSRSSMLPLGMMPRLSARCETSAAKPSKSVVMRAMISYREPQPNVTRPSESTAASPPSMTSSRSASITTVMIAATGRVLAPRLAKRLPASAFSIRVTSELNM